jgi:DNA-binding MarR family transcriptional regulator
MGSHASTDSAAAAVDCLRRIVRALRESSRESEQRVGISGAQLFVLRELAAGPGQSVSDLARRTLTHQSSVSVVVQRLVDGGFVARARSSSDLRRKGLRLTARGRALLERAPPLAQERLIDAVRKLPRNQRWQLASRLAEVAEGMGAAGAAAPMFFEERGARIRRRKIDAGR